MNLLKVTYFTTAIRIFVDPDLGFICSFVILKRNTCIMIIVLEIKGLEKLELVPIFAVHC